MTTSTAPTKTAESATARSRTTTLNVLIADKFEKGGIERLQELGCRVEFNPELTATDLPETIASLDPDVIVVRSTKVPGPVFEADWMMQPATRKRGGES